MFETGSRSLKRQCLFDEIPIANEVITDASSDYNMKCQ